MSNQQSHLRHIGQMVRQLREARGMSQQDLADAAALRRATVTDIENGKANFEINTLVRIAAALNCAIDIILTPQ
jgi:transcriptional regulator with XRE-family HTH domain